MQQTSLLKTPVAEAAPLAQPATSTLPVKTIDIDQLITDDAAKYGVNREHLYKTLYCESAGLKDPAIVGDNGLAIGFAQIRMDYHPDISVASASDATFAVDYMAHQFSIGEASEWTCWRMLEYNKWDGTT